MPKLPNSYVSTVLTGEPPLERCYLFVDDEQVKRGWVGRAMAFREDVLDKLMFTSIGSRPI